MHGPGVGRIVSCEALLVTSRVWLAPFRDCGFHQWDLHRLMLTVVGKDGEQM